jgi:hypothetical protein
MIGARVRTKDRDGRQTDKRATRALLCALCLFPFRSAALLVIFFVFLTACFTGGRRVSARRASRAELRRKSTPESGVAYRIPASASRPLGPGPATSERTNPPAAARPGPPGGKNDEEADGCAGVQRVRRDHLCGRWERPCCDVHDRRCCEG